MFSEGLENSPFLDFFFLQEPAEACNKFVKKFQLEHSRQTNPKDRNYDTFMRLQNQSDPHVHRFLCELGKNPLIC